MNHSLRARLMLSASMAIFGTLSVFVRNIPLASGELALYRAVLAAQNAAEEVKSVCGDFAQAAELYGGTWNGQLWGRSYDADWARDGDDYHVLVTPADSGDALLGAAEVAVYTAEGDLLFTLPVAWQEVADHG